MHALRRLLCAFNNIFNKIILEVTFLGRKTQLKSDACWNVEDVAAELIGQQIIFAKKYSKVIFLNTSIHNIEMKSP